MLISRKATVVLLLLLGGGVLKACTISGLPIEGQVLEAGTGKPIAGAMVVVDWSGSIFAFVESRSACVHSEIVTTDADGRYETPFWWGFPDQPYFSVSWHMNSYKPGYTRNDEYNRGPHFITARNIDLLEPSKGDRTQILEYLLQLARSASCGHREEAGKLASFYRALYREAKEIGAASQKDAELLVGLQYYLELAHADGDAK